MTTFAGALTAAPASAETAAEATVLHSQISPSSLRSSPPGRCNSWEDGAIAFYAGVWWECRFAPSIGGFWWVPQG
ncbi:hypothetical protein [Actinomadura sp. 9N215]|uniref:hypothetical protein n=1 Tax=Actinomadura sp. 9N215 TaxID=3375150 RepID=UPI0037940CA5